MTNYKTRLKENIKQFSELLKLLFPQNKLEFSLFLGFTIFYLSYSLVIALNTCIADYQGYWYDAYFSFDNPIIYNKGNVYLEGHPLMKFIWYPFILVGNILGIAFGYKAKTVFVVTLCSSIISMSVVYIYRYLSNIIKLKGYVLSLLLLLFGFFSTNMILCFTIESFTLTITLLSFTVYYYSYCMQEGKGVTLLSNAFLAITLGGITLTNFAKGVAPMFFAKEDKKVIVRKIFIVGVLFAVCILVSLFMEYNFDFFYQLKYRLTQNVSLPSKGLYYEKIIDMLFTAPMFFPDVVFGTTNNDFGGKIPSINMDFLRHWWQYAFSAIIFILLAYSVFKHGKKNKHVQILLLMLAVDVVIHVFIRYGLRDAQIYGAHWIFVVPILLGWLYKSLNSKKIKQGFLVLLTCLFIGMLANNIYQLTQFIEIAIEHFPPHDNIELSVFF